MKNKKTLKVLALALAFVLVAGIAIGGTIAYLTSTPDPVINTFTVGKVDITLNEHLVDANGKIITGDGAKLIPNETDDLTGNAYKLVPGKIYDKDPTVHVLKGSEECYVFIMVENGLVSFEPTGETANTIAKQIGTNGWTALDGVSNVYYKKQAAIAADAADVDLPVFTTFTISADKTATDLANVTNETIVKITAYAIQYAGFENKPADAWTAVSTAANG